MKTITKTYKVYTFDELSDEAKKKVKNDHSDFLAEVETFTEICNEKIKNTFPNSNLKVQYDFSCSQGNGLNIYGDLDFNDVLENNKNEFSEKEIKTLKEYLEYVYDYHIKPNRYYTYCTVEQENFYNDIIWDLKEFFEKINKDLIKKFDNIVRDFISGFCDDLYNEGYDFFYNISDEEMKEYCEINEYTFLADGTLFS